MTVGLPLPLVVVGAGRLGLVVAEALRDAGLEVLGVVARSEAGRLRCAERGMPALDDARGAATAVLCVPDDAIASAASSLPDTVRFVVHTSGCAGLDLLDQGREAALASVHPLHSFTPADRGLALAGVPLAVTARDEGARAFAFALARALGGRPFALDEAAKPLYHAAATLAANGAVAVLDAAIACAAAAGMREPEARAALTTLAATAVRQVQALGATDALTGPVARGDSGTIRAHRQALASRLPERLPIYDATARTALDIARRRGLDDTLAGTVERSLTEAPTP